MKEACVTRFAPSPTGCLHLGHALAAWVAWARAREQGGRFLLRIEDLDPGRSRAAFEQGIFEDLEWLGLHWDGEVLRQSERAVVYENAMTQLRRHGLVYPCFCTRREIAAEIERMGEAPHGPSGPRYPGTCRGLADAEISRREEEGRVPVWRLDSARALAGQAMPNWRELGCGRQDEATNTEPDDVVLARKDAISSYHLAVVVDDAAQGVTLVTRGVDLAACTPVQRLLQGALALPEPKYEHHPLVTDEQGRRFAKRDQSVTLEHLRREGWTPARVFSHLRSFLDARGSALARLAEPG